MNSLRAIEEAKETVMLTEQTQQLLSVQPLTLFREKDCASLSK